MYKLEHASKKDIPLLIKYKLATIFEYAKDMAEDEKKKIICYVEHSIPNLLNDYQLVIKEDVIIGCVLTTLFQDGILLDEIYLEEDYRNLGIGSNIIENIVHTHDIVYLWVYKENTRAIKLYKKYHFTVYDETETRFLMIYKLK